MSIDKNELKTKIEAVYTDLLTQATKARDEKNIAFFKDKLDASSLQTEVNHAARQIIKERGLINKYVSDLRTVYSPAKGR